MPLQKYQRVIVNIQYIYLQCNDLFKLSFYSTTQHEFIRFSLIGLFGCDDYAASRVEMEAIKIQQTA